MGAIIGALYAESLNTESVAARIRTYVEDLDFIATWEPFVEKEGDPPTTARAFIQELRRAVQRRIVSFRTFSSPSPLGADRLREPLYKLYHTRRLEDLRLPFAAVAIDLLTGQPCIFHQGDLINAIYASSAIPGVFPPLKLGERLLVDGGGPYRVPVNTCRHLGADVVLAVDIPSFSFEKDEYKTGLDILMRADEIARSRLNRFVLRDADLVVRPEVGGFHWASFSAVDRIQGAGAAAMQAALPRLRGLLRRHGSLPRRLGRALGRWRRPRTRSTQ
jgi:NTE family protein